MKEQLVTFPTAKLAKEKGFNIDTIPILYQKEHKSIVHITGGYNDREDQQRYISAPTQSLLQRWLRELHKIEVACIPAYSSILNNVPNFLKGEFLGKKKYANYCCFVNNNKDNVEETEKDDYLCYHDSYEETLEKGLYQALLLIKS